MRFIQEHGFSFELALIEPDCRCQGELLCIIKNSCWIASATNWAGATALLWKARGLLVWYARTGEILYLRSIVETHTWMV